MCNRVTLTQYTEDLYTLDVDYQEQYNSLCLRCDVLQSESEDIHHNIHKLNQEIEKNHEQVANIDRQEKRSVNPFVNNCKIFLVYKFQQYTI